MIRQFVARFSAPAGQPITYQNRALTLFQAHPLELALMLEDAWNNRFNNTAVELGHPERRSDLGGVVRVGVLPIVISPLAPMRWHHLIYAYMIENTRIYEIFDRVVNEFVHGEQLGVPLPSAEHWLRNTEELFYKDPAPFLITSVASHIRRDLRATRRNAYHRMFGIDLNHGTSEKNEYPYVKGNVSNTEFITTFEDFLREVWVGISNLTTASGPNPTDDSAIANLAERLHAMLISRRKTGNLSREEFYAVSTMSWFHLSLEFDSPIVLALRAEATTPEERLFKIAERVKLPAHGRSRSFFEIAELTSVLLTLIETGVLNTAPSARALFDKTVPVLLPPGVQPLPDIMRTIITHYSIVRGHNMKTMPQRVTA